MDEDETLEDINEQTRYAPRSDGRGRRARRFARGMFKQTRLKMILKRAGRGKLVKSRVTLPKVD